MFQIWWVRTLLKALLLPPLGPLLVVLAGLLLLRSERTAAWGRRLAWTGTVALLLLAMPATGALLGRFLDATPAFDPTRPGPAQAIVVLGGGTRHNAPEYGGDTVGRLTLERVRYAAFLARRTGLPLLVSGGVVSGGSAEAAVMADTLVNEFSVPVRWIENRSRNTRENARFSAAILAREGIRNVVLVGHSFDLPRSLAEFRDAGLVPVGAPTGIPDFEVDNPLDFVPTLGGLTASYYSLYELLGLLARRLGL